MAEKICIPDIGDFEQVEIIEVLVAVGDTVSAEQSLITLESDKATLDVPSPVAGVIRAITIKAGDKVSEGDHIADIEIAADSPAPAAETSPPPAETPTATPPAETPPPPAAKPAAETTQTSGTEKICIPDIGDFKQVEIIEVLVAVGDTVSAEQSLITLESDKATLDVPAPVAGVIRAITIKAGDKVSEGDHIADIAVAADSPAPAAETSPPPPPAETPATPPPAAPPPAPAAAKPPPAPAIAETKSAKKPHAGPAVRRLARDLGVDLTVIRGSGRKGRIVKEDLYSHVKATITKPQDGGLSAFLAVAPTDFRQFGEIELHPLTRINKLSAATLHRNWVAAPHVTQFAESDITDMEEFRQSLVEEAKRNGYKMTPLVFLIKAAVAALRQFPRFNASLLPDGETLALKKYYNIGVAVDTPTGLVVPVVRDADKKGLADIARELAELSSRAREGKIKREDLQGGCFTISSLGGIGGSAFTPIINLPEIAIMGVSRSQLKPLWDKNSASFVPRLILPLSLSYDHRVVDGAEGARFISFYADLLSDIRRLAL